MYRIYVVEDDPKIARLVGEHLRKYNYEVHTALRLDRVKEEFDSFAPHLVLLDVNLPFFDGFYWCRLIRAASTVPVIFLTARAGDMDQVMAIEHGADDYIVKPFSLDVLTAKVKGVLRRSYGDYANSPDVAGQLRAEAGQTSEFGRIRLNSARLELQFADRRTSIGRNEALLMSALLNARGAVVSRARLLELLWDDTSFVDDNTLTVNVTRLRRRLDELGAPDLIETVRGVGYKLLDGAPSR